MALVIFCVAFTRRCGCADPSAKAWLDLLPSPLRGGVGGGGRGAEGAAGTICPATPLRPLRGHLPRKGGGNERRFHQLNDFANVSTAPFSLPAVSSARSREVRIASRISGCLPRTVESSPSSKARTRFTGSGSR